MKIPAYQIENFIKSRLSSVKAVLLYGTDPGLVSEYKDSIIKQILGDKFDPFELKKIDAESVHHQLGEFIDQLNAMSLLSNCKLFVINDCPAGFHSSISKAMAKNKSDNFLLLISGNLPPTSGLRKLFESAGDIAALACYKDEAKDIARIIRGELQNYQIDDETINYISHHVSGNRLILRQELAKIKLFYGERRRILFEEIQELVSNIEDNDLQDFANAVAGFDPRAEAILEAMIAQGLQVISLIRVLYNYFNRIYQTKLLMTQNQDFNSAIASLSPPVFFKQKEILRTHLDKFSLKGLELIFERLMLLEQNCKSYSFIDQSLLFKFFLLRFLRK